ncbi:hypothetical protein [Methylomonas rosea]|uniref:Uncharacterized protein n=1 Tax=Methylomonas rosea TaxID=2952227 RepID=A0ABT1TT22_9GAMM|nr:hypothetical protein [Methylomonas sp. WSC-7]MCQ8117922.1 hypothetical protein [Methylomonas sp. WSC-7]
MSRVWILKPAEGIAIGFNATSEASVRVADHREGIPNSPGGI